MRTLRSLPILLLLLLLVCSVSAELSREIVESDTERSTSDVKARRGSNALLALIQHQTSRIDRIHDDLEDLEDKLHNLPASSDKKLRDDLEDLKYKLQKVEQKTDANSALLKVNVGFMAQVRSDRTQGSNSVVKFDSVQYNQGNAYNPHTGMFTAPMSGTYTFFIKTETSPRRICRLYVVKEGKRVLYIYGLDANSYQTPSAQVLLPLTKGDRVWVQTANTGNNFVRVWTRFGGFLVHPNAA